ncbi:MAG: HAMP domain-containing sensor histidine kinase [Patescibacteria group bacterium]|nr:HAMP domain-containing sensor histidine kinase [Patescibacteria group bacterium]
MGRSYAIFWYYLLLIVLVLAPFALEQFLPADFPLPSRGTPLAAVLILFALALVFNPFLFAWFRQRRRPRLNIPATPPPKPVVGGLDKRQLEAAKQKAKDLETRTRELEAKDMELTMANQHLQELERAKSEFVAVTTHQLRTPLSAIKWTLHMLLKDEIGKVTTDQKHYLQASFDSVERVISTVNQLLNLDRIVEDHQEDYHLVSADLTKLIEGVISEFAAPAKEKKVPIIFSKPTAMAPPVEMDPVKMSMVLENLLDNAIRYSPDSQDITVTLKDDKLNSARNILEVVVTDKGIGIPAAEQGKIFSRFYRAGNAAVKSPNGLGLGLFAAKTIITRHGGEIWFVSEEGKGTEFHFTIPLKQAKV